MGWDRMVCKRNEELRWDLGIAPRCYPRGGDCFAGRDFHLGLCYDHCRPGYNGILGMCWKIGEASMELEYLQTKEEEARDKVLALEASEPAPMTNLKYLKAREEEARFKALTFEVSESPNS